MFSNVRESYKETCCQLMSSKILKQCKTKMMHLQEITQIALRRQYTELSLFLYGKITNKY